VKYNNGKQQRVESDWGKPRKPSG